jgi:hypothetical protein
VVGGGVRATREVRELLWQDECERFSKIANMSVALFDKPEGEFCGFGSPLPQ